MIYRTRDGDRLDAIVFAYYGSTEPLVKVLKANPGLADRGPVYPTGVEIELPDVAPEPEIKAVLWT